jgi:hypothetical protein
MMANPEKPGTWSRFAVETTTIRTEINTATKQLADRLVSMENEARTIAPEDDFAVCRACEKLRRPLTRLVGIGGYRALLQRALILAQRESPTLSGVEVNADGSMVGLESSAAEANSILVAHLIHLLMTFIGQSLTLTLLQDIWPEIKGLDEPSEKDGHEK